LLAANDGQQPKNNKQTKSAAAAESTTQQTKSTNKQNQRQQQNREWSKNDGAAKRLLCCWREKDAGIPLGLDGLASAQKMWRQSGWGNAGQTNKRFFRSKKLKLL
jgi:hypothetical protein